MKKHSREQENSKPEKHSWFRSKKADKEASDVVEEVSGVEEKVSDVVEDATDIVEEVSDVEEKASDKAEGAFEEASEIIEEAAEETAEPAVEKITESVTDEVEEVSDLVENAEDTEPAVEEITESVTDEVDEVSDLVEVSEESEAEEEPEAEELEEETESEEESEEETVTAVVAEEKSKKEKKEPEDVEEASEEDSEENDDTDDEQKDKEESEKEKSALYMFFDTIKFVAIGLLIGILLVVFVVQRNDVYGSSMEPTLYSGDAVFVEMISVYTGNFSRGDIVTIDAKGMDGYSHEENLIKRIIGLPGETIKIEDGNVYINGQLLDESDYLPAGTKTYVGAEGQSKGYAEITLGPDEYYCMGDNRGGSNDSRRMGPFKKGQIEAKVLMRIYPFNKMKFF